CCTEAATSSRWRRGTFSAKASSRVRGKWSSSSATRSPRQYARWPRDKIDALSGELGGDAARVRFEDMENVGRNPARIIPACQEFVGEGSGRALRGIGEHTYASQT